MCLPWLAEWGYLNEAHEEALIWMSLHLEEGFYLDDARIWMSLCLDTVTI